MGDYVCTGYLRELDMACLRDSPDESVRQAFLLPLGLMEKC